MRIGILGGTGKEGAGLARRWAQSGHDIIIGSRDAERARAKSAELSGQAGRAISGMSNRVAAASAEVVVLAMPASGLAATLGELTDACRGKVVISTVVPLSFGVSTLVENSEQIASWSKSLETLAIPQPPAWVETLPAVGDKLADWWRQLAAISHEELTERLAPYARAVAVWFAGQVGSIAVLIVQFLLMVVMVAILYAKGEAAARGVDRFARRLAGQRGENAVHLAGQAIRGIALGVVVTAIVQSVAAGLGLAVVGVPFAAILTAVMFILCIAQVGPGLVLIPAVIWVYSTRGGVWGTGLLLWSIFCTTFDNFLRPMLIKQGADLPLLLIFAGVIGGLIAFGVIGLFIGPVVLAVAYMLMLDWMSQDTPSNEQAPP